MHKLINLQVKVNNELKWLQSQSLMPESVAEIPENNLPEFSLMLLEGRENACFSQLSSFKYTGLPADQLFRFLPPTLTLFSTSRY